jgi:hypothetical protein
MASIQNEDETDAYYVRISSTVLVLLASFSSTIASLLVGCVMVFLSYPVSKHLLMSSQHTPPEGIPTVYQLGLLMTSLDAGGWWALWRWLKYNITTSGPSKLKVLTVTGYGLLVAHVLVYGFPFSSLPLNL